MCMRINGKPMKLSERGQNPFTPSNVYFLSTTSIKIVHADYVRLYAYYALNQFL